MSNSIIPKNVEIDQLKLIPIADIWHKYGGGELKQAGKELAGRCSRHGSDTTPSLMINPEKNSFYCFGCQSGGDTIELTSWLLGRDFKEAIKILSRDFNIGRTQVKHPVNEVIYNYTDASGTSIYQVVRKNKGGKKTVTQRRPDGDGGWIWNLKGVEPLPYRLPELLKAISTGDTIYIAEGEKCVDALNIILGLPATTNSGGAGKWTSKHSQYFPAETEVIILPDNDTPGRNHVQSVAKDLLGRGCRVKIIDLPGLSDITTNKGTGEENGADVADWLSTGHTKEELLVLADTSPYWEAATVQSAEEENGLDAVLSKLEELPEKERRKYFNETVLPLLVDTEPIAGAQATKKAANLLNVSMEVIKSAVRQLTGDSTTEQNQADILIDIALSNTLFHDELKEPYALIEFDDCNRIIKVGQGKDFTRYLSGEYYKQNKTSPYNEAIRQAVNVVESKAVFDGKEYKLELRVAKHNEAFWYDLADEKNRAIKITPGSWQIVNRPPILFRRRSNQDKQVEPLSRAGDVWLLSNFVNLDDDSLRLLIIYLVTCLIPGIPHVIPVFHGEKGAAKSTTMQFIRRLIDPAKRELFTLPKDQNELALQLFGNYMPCYDNLSGISQMQSDMLCMASTGGGISKRTLYSNDDDTILKFFCNPILNGINVVASATDLLDRCIIFELKRIPEENRKEMSKVFADFESARPAIFTGLLDTLSKARKLHPSINLSRLPRMADFARWGYAIAEVLGIGGDNFMRLYRENMDKVNTAAIDENAVATAIVALMGDGGYLNCTMAELLGKIDEMAEELKIDVRARHWPKQPNALSKQLTQIKSNLLDAGIKYDSVRKGKGVHIVLVKEGNPSTLSTHLHKPNNGAGYGSVDSNVDDVDTQNTYTLSTLLPTRQEPSKFKGCVDSVGSVDEFGYSTKNETGVCPPKEIIEF